MIKQPAKVIAETEISYLLESLPKSACPQCDSGKGCGGGLLAKAFSNKTYQLELNKNKKLSINEIVQIGISSQLLVRASFIVYFLPLLMMVLTALVAGLYTNNQDVYTVFGAIIGFVGGLMMANVLSNRLYKMGISSPILIENDVDSCWYEAD
ncbi:MAG: sigma-E factor negative regulatory protein RseC [Enterobacterales bacterium]|jgi:sigma-E factor negative regulatory protein RseC